jgi:hypothetical protein
LLNELDDIYDVFFANRNSDEFEDILNQILKNFDFKNYALNDSILNLYFEKVLNY